MKPSAPLARGAQARHRASVAGLAAAIVLLLIFGITTAVDRRHLDTPEGVASAWLHALANEDCRRAHDLMVSLSTAKTDCAQLYALLPEQALGIAEVREIGYSCGAVQLLARVRDENGRDAEFALAAIVVDDRWRVLDPVVSRSGCV